MKPVMTFAGIFVGATLAAVGGLMVSNGNPVGAMMIGVGVLNASLAASSARKQS